MNGSEFRTAAFCQKYGFHFLYSLVHVVVDYSIAVFVGVTALFNGDFQAFLRNLRGGISPAVKAAAKLPIVWGSDEISKT